MIGAAAEGCTEILDAMEERVCRDRDALNTDGPARTTRSITVVNTLSFPRSDVIYLPFEGCYVDGDYPQQVVEDREGEKKLAVQGVTIPAFGSKVLLLTEEYREGASVFTADGRPLILPSTRTAPVRRYNSDISIVLLTGIRILKRRNSKFLITNIRKY